MQSTTIVMNQYTDYTSMTVKEMNYSKKGRHSKKGRPLRLISIKKEYL